MEVSPDRRHIPPQFGWRVRLNHTFPEKPKASVIPRWSQVPKLVGLAYRFLKYARSVRKKGHLPFIDPFSTVACRQQHGVPLGGIGAGTIGRGWKGDFNRWQMHPGIYRYNVVDVNQFTICIRKDGKTIYQQVLSPCAPSGKLNCDKSLQAWKWNFDGGNAVYHALYPRAWTVYDIPSFKLRLTCRQISPVFPHEYKDTSLPVGVFVWTIENNGKDDLDISIMLSFQNGMGDSTDSAGGHYNEAFVCKGVYSEIRLQNEDNAASGYEIKGDVGVSNGDLNDVSLKRNHRENCTIHDVSGVLMYHAHPRTPYTLAIAAKQIMENDKPCVAVTSKVSFDSKTPCRKIWEDLAEDGLLSTKAGDPNRKSLPGQTLAAAVAAKVTVPASKKREVEFVISWDMPIVEFGAKGGVKYCRRYTRFFGDKGNAAPGLCCHALQHYSEWESQIESWQNPVLEDSTLPDWYKSALFNELYYIVDGGTVWLDIRREKDMHKRPVPALIKEYGRFAYLEGHEYRMYNTYDVHYYASWALVMHWPKLQLSLQYDVSQSVLQSDLEERIMMLDGERAPRKIAGCIPHDMGDPEDEPFLRVNAYIIHDTGCWKDLNLKFVLQVYRDYYLTEDKQFLMDMWPAMKAVMVTAMGQDTDGDGLIDNSGFPDQTFDCWVVTGASAYCGGLWLGALRCMVEIAKLLDLKDNIERYQLMLNKGKEAYVRKLWNGRYYNYDCCERESNNSIMADQCAGQWYLKACDLGQDDDDRVFPKDHVQSALKTVFQMNVMRFQGGFMGAVNGMKPDGSIDTSSLQAEEVWTGVTYAVAANMIQEGLVKEGFRTAEGIYRTCFEKLGLGFQTPEAFVANGNFRSLGYMRPLSIWGMQWALQKRKPGRGRTGQSTSGMSEWTKQ